MSLNMRPDVPAGGPVICFQLKKHFLGRLRKGGPPDDNGEYLISYPYINSCGFKKYSTEHIPVDRLALPFNSWPTTKPLSHAWTPGDLRQGTQVVIEASKFTRGTLVVGDSPERDGTCMVAYMNKKNGKMEEEFCTDELAVPLETWRMPPSWPDLPAGTKVFLVADKSAHQRSWTTTDVPPSAHGGYHIDQDGKSQEVAPCDLLVPLANRWVPPPSSESGHRKYPRMPADMKIYRASSKDILCTVINGPAPDAPDGAYKVLIPNNSAGVYEESLQNGTDLAVSLQTRLQLHDMAALKPGISSLQAQVEEKNVHIGKLENNETTLSAELTKHKSECKKAKERISNVSLSGRVLPNSAGEHDYGSNLPSPADLVKRIGSIQDQLFEAWIEKTLEDPKKNTWLASEDAFNAIEDLRLHRLQFDDMAALKQVISSLQAQVEEKNVHIGKLENNETRLSAELTKHKSECKKAKERIGNVSLSGGVLPNSAGEHDDGSNLPSPADLVKRIGSIQDQLFVDWIAEALGDPKNTWLASQDVAKAIEDPRTFVLQVLVETAHECYRRVHECVSRRTTLMTDLMGEFGGAAHDGLLAQEVAHFKRTAYHKRYKEMFAEVCPVSPNDRTVLAQDIFRGLAECTSVSNISPNGPTALDALFNTTKAAYEDIVKNLLMTFLECEVQQSAPLKFSENFGSREAWNPEEHFKETFDPSYEGDKPVAGSTQVQVVIPRLFWEKKADDSNSLRFFETQASFVIRNASATVTHERGEYNQLGPRTNNAGKPAWV